MNKFFLLIITVGIFYITGCITQPKVEPVKSWENHYFTVKEFKENTKNIKLDKDESIWVLSNKTMKRLLKNTEKYYE